MTTDRPSARPTQARFTFLDYGRGIACLMVVLYHASGTASLPKYFGAQGLSEVFTLGFVRMPFFFAMSGFLLAWFYFKPGGTTTASAFLGKRMARLFPLYWIVLCAVAAADLFILQSADGVPSDSGWWATFFLLPQDPVVVGGTGAPVLYPAWVLQYELVGYLLIALSLANRHFRFAYLYYFPLCYLLWRESSVFGLRFLGSDWLLVYWFGVVAAFAARNGSARQLRWLLGSAVLTLACAVVLQWSRARHADWQFLADLHLNLLYGVGFALLMAGLVELARSKPASGSAPSRWAQGVNKLAVWSYAIFLLHAPIITLVCKLLVAAGLTGATGWNLAVAGSLLVSVIAGAVAQALIEEPLNRMIGAAAGFKGALLRWKRQGQS